MTLVKDAPRTSTSLIVRSDANTRITASRDPFYELMRRLFQNESSAIRGQRFVMLILERDASGNPIRTEEWRQLLDEFDISISSFYAMRNKLLGAGMITNKKGVYRVSGQFGKDLVDMARWWWVAVLKRDLDSL
ncbi:MAG: hypothetical protein KAT13_05530 [Methanosarcinales archaeon]|jgi:hypothetical protein|nr:hypothetical protein [Methanosarcinales archaeon]